MKIDSRRPKAGTYQVPVSPQETYCEPSSFNSRSRSFCRSLRVWRSSFCFWQSVRCSCFNSCFSCVRIALGKLEFFSDSLASFCFSFKACSSCFCRASNRVFSDSHCWPAKAGPARKPTTRINMHALCIITSPQPNRNRGKRPTNARRWPQYSLPIFIGYFAKRMSC